MNDDYLAWRLSFQSADQAARAAFDEAQKLRAEVARQHAEILHLMIYAPGRNVVREPVPIKQIAPTNFAAWGISMAAPAQ
jgi:hypothetical protein